MPMLDAVPPPVSTDHKTLRIIKQINHNLALCAIADPNVLLGAECRRTGTLSIPNIWQAALNQIDCW